MTSIFLSYARIDDEAFVRRLHADLTSAGFDVWFDRVSMPSRQLTFHQEIRDAIAARDRLLLVVGPGVLTSDYVTQEWRFAYFETGKCVNPIVRLNGATPDGAIIDGYELIPEDLKLLHAEDFRDEVHYDAQLANLIRQLSEAIPPVGKLVAVPELPACFLSQPERIKALRDLLLVDLQKPVVVSGAAARVGLQGMGGIGKSVLASALAHRPEVRRAFPDGIFWITLGQKPQLAELQRWLALELGDVALFPDERSGKECLRKLLAGRKALLVLDDVWQREDAEAFNVIGAMGRILLTTRDTGLVTALASKEAHYRVELPTDAEAEGIFAAAAQLDPRALSAATREIVAQCGRLPLALALCGGMVQGGVSPADVREALREHDLEFLSSDHPAEEQHRNAWKAMDVSLRVMPPEQRDRFAELAVFALDRGAPEAAVVTLWEHTGGLTPRHGRKLLADFAARSLVQLTPAADRDQNGARMTLHDLLHNFAEGMAEKRFGSRTALHQTLLDAYRKKCPSNWASGPCDGYYFESLCEHLLDAGKLTDAVELLTDLPWIEAKCKVKLVFSLQDDYRNTIAAMPEAQEGRSEERERQARLNRWTEEITAYSHQWSERRDRLVRGEIVTEPEPQLPQAPTSCRIWKEGEIESECRRIIESPSQLDRLRLFARFVASESYALLEFGSRPMFVLQHAFNDADAGAVHNAADQIMQFLGQTNECQPVGGQTRVVWLQKQGNSFNPRPAMLRTLEGHNDPISSVDISADGRRAVSGSEDLTVRVWDLETGSCLRVFGGHTKRVSSVCITFDGKYAASGSQDKTIRVWDLESGECLWTLEGHLAEVLSLCISPDCKYLVSGGWGTSIKSWDLATGANLQELDGETWAPEISMTPDTRYLVSVHRTGRARSVVRLWDLMTGECRKMDGPLNVTVYGVCVTPEARRAIIAGTGEYDVPGYLSMCDMDTGDCRQVIELREEAITAVGVTADGRFALSNGGNSVRLWDVGSGECVRLLEGHSARVRSVKMTPDGRRAISGASDNTLRVWDLEAGKCAPQPSNRHDDEVRILEVSPDSRVVVSVGSCEASAWDLRTGAFLWPLDPKSQYNIDEVCFSMDNRFVQTRAGGIHMEGHPFSMHRVWDLATGKCTHEERGAGFADTLCNVRKVTADGGCVVLAYPNGQFVVGHRGPDNHFEVLPLKGHIGGITSVSLRPDGSRAVSAGKDKSLRLWDLATGDCLRVLSGHTSEVWGVTFTPDGKRTVSTGQDFTLRIWELASGECESVVRLSAPGTAVAVSPDLAHVIVGTASGEVLFFEPYALNGGRDESLRVGRGAATKRSRGEALEGGSEMQPGLRRFVRRVLDSWHNKRDRD